MTFVGPDGVIGERERDIRRQLADLARHAPALFSDAVRYADYLRRRGCARLEASARALEWARNQWRGRQMAGTAAVSAGAGSATTPPPE